MAKNMGCMIGLEGTCLMGHTRPWRPLTRGMLHESVLGRVSFIIFTNNLEEVTEWALLSSLKRPPNWGEMAKENIFKKKYSAREHN